MVAVKRPRRLFSKNIGLCKLERGGIGADACPVPRLKKLVSLRMKLATEAPVNGGRNYNGPKVAKFLVG